MKAINEFEFGRKEFDRKLEAVGKRWELKSGDYRIILESRGGRFYGLVAVGNRRDIFDIVSPARYG